MGTSKKLTAEELQVRFEQDRGQAKKALLALFERQTSDEQDTHSDIHKNGTGFCLCDVKAFSAIAVKVLGGAPLDDASYAYLLAKTGRGKGRLAKYVRQLNEIEVDPPTDRPLTRILPPLLR